MGRFYGNEKKTGNLFCLVTRLPKRLNNMNTPIETQTEFAVVTPETRAGEQMELFPPDYSNLQIRSTVTNSHTVAFSHPDGKMSTLDFNNGRLVFSGEVDGSAIMFLNSIHGFTQTRTGELYNRLLTYRGVKNVNGDYLGDETAAEQLFVAPT